MLKRVHPYGHAYVIRMAFLKCQQMAMTLAVLMPAIARGVFFFLPLCLPSLLFTDF